jgi:nucleoside-diphosphate kinase
LAYTVFIIKPDAVSRHSVGRILARIESEGFELREMSLVRLSLAEAQRFYAVHRERPFFDELCRFMASGPCVPCLLEGPVDAIQKLRTLMGDTDSRAAESGTLRQEFGTDKGSNAVHGSDGPDTARDEMAFWAVKLGWRLPTPAGR